MRIKLINTLISEPLLWPDVGKAVAERVTKEILKSWLSTGVNESELVNIEKITEIEKKYYISK